MFIRLYHQELEKDKRRFTLHFFFPFYNIAGALQHFFQFAAYPVLLVHILRGAINGNDEAVKPTFYSLPGFFICEVMRIGGSGGINSLVVGIFYHRQKLRVQVRLALEIKNKV